MSEEKKKADAIVEMFLNNLSEEYQADLLELQKWLQERIRKRAIECAKLHVKGIIEAKPSEPWDFNDTLEFWSGVLTELNKM